MKNQEKPSVFKDRYSYVLIALVVSTSVLFVMTIMLLKNGKSSKEAPYLGIIGGMMFFGVIMYLLNAQAKAHLTEEQKEMVKNGNIKFKPENGCGWYASPELAQKGFDGIKIMKKRYKVADGADVYINSSGKVVSLGPGSQLIQKLRKAGKETVAIQKDDCWK